MKRREVQYVGRQLVFGNARIRNSEKPQGRRLQELVTEVVIFAYLVSMGGGGGGLLHS